MRYIKLVIAIADEYQETFIAELLDFGFDSFEQQENLIITYIPEQSFNDVHRQRIEQLLSAYPGENYLKSKEIITDQNWNEQWEQTIKARQIGFFFVKPTWSTEQSPEESILLEIDPKMAFGTGYHETTRLMLQLLPDAITKGDKVMDAGTGTGILAIASVKLGAQKVVAFDIDEWSITNARENIYLNDVVDNITLKKGSIEVIPQGQEFNVILANIERNPILNMFNSFYDALKPGGLLLISGLLKKDEQVITQKAKKLGFSIKKITRENEWISILLVNQ